MTFPKWRKRTNISRDLSSIRIPKISIWAETVISSEIHLSNNRRGSWKGFSCCGKYRWLQNSRFFRYGRIQERIWTFEFERIWTLRSVNGAIRRTFQKRWCLFRHHSKHSQRKQINQQNESLKKQLSQSQNKINNLKNEITEKNNVIAKLQSEIQILRNNQSKKNKLQKSKSLNNK